MNRVRGAAIVAVLPCLLLAQENKIATQTRPPNVETRMIRLQHADPHQVRDLLVGAGASAQWDDQLRVVVVSGTPSDVATLEQTAKELDAEMAKVPASNAEFTIYVLGASQDEVAAASLPPALQKTADQIKAAFPYRYYQLLETVVARSRIGEQTSVSGTLQPLGHQDQRLAGQYPSYRVQFRLAGISSSGSHDSFRVQGFFFDGRIPVLSGTDPNATQVQMVTPSIRTDFDITSNQQVVIGKTGVPGNSAIFVIVEAKAVK